jgi:hypothetical protein
MYVAPAAPLSVGGVLDDAIKLYRASLRSCWVVGLIGALVAGASTIWMLSSGMMAGLAAKPSTDPTVAMARAFQMVSVVGKVYFLAGLVSLLIFAMLFAKVSAVHRGATSPTLGEALTLSLRRLPGMILAVIVFAVATSLGTALLLIPGIYLWGKLEFWIAAVFEDDIGGIESLGRSWNATTGNWWRSVTILSIALIMIVVLQVIIYLLSAVMIATPSLFLHPDVLSLTFIVPMLVRSLLSIFILPMYPVVMVAIYHDMKLRREGGDLAARAHALRSGASVPSA